MAQIRVHLVAGGFPAGSTTGHDIDFARLSLLQLLGEYPGVVATVANDFSDLATWLPGSQFLVSYVAGPHLNDEQNELVREWLVAGGRWLGLHGPSGGKAARVGERGLRRKMVKTSHHETLGSFFLNHPPVRKFRVDVRDRQHPITRGLPASFEVMDELYLIELQSPGDCQVLLTTELETDPSPPGFGFVYDADTSLQADGRTRVLGYLQPVGAGAVTYVALGHCHAPTNNIQPFVDPSVAADGKTPPLFRGSWETEPFPRLLRNGIAWGVGAS